MEKIITSRLTLREIKSKDIFGYTELFSDSETMKLYGGTTVSSDLEIKDVVQKKRYEEKEGISFFWTITLSDEKDFIGFVRLMSYNSIYFDLSYKLMGTLKNSPEVLKYIDRKNGWEIDYALLKDYRKIGIMTESILAILNFCRVNNIAPIYAKVNSIETKSTISVLLKTGFIEYLPQANQEGKFGMIYKWE